jgi:uncharacterized protein
MIFEIDDIPEGGLSFEVDQKSGHFEIDQEDCTLSANVRVQGTLKKVSKEVYLEGRLQTEVQVLCGRCLEPVRAPVDCDVSARFVPEPNTRRANKGEAEMLPADADTEPYSGHKIDITAPVHDQILLAIPQVVLCKPDCAGLCPDCGINLNTGSCNCNHEETIDPRLAVLKGLKDKLKK